MLLKECWRSEYPLLFTRPLLLLAMGLFSVNSSHQGFVLILLVVRLVEFGHVERLILEGVDGSSAGIVLAGIKEAGEGKVFRKECDSFQNDMRYPSWAIGTSDLDLAFLMRNGDVSEAFLTESVTAGRQQTWRVGFGEFFGTARAGDFGLHSFVSRRLL